MKEEEEEKGLGSRVTQWDSGACEWQDQCQYPGLATCTCASSSRATVHPDIDSSHLRPWFLRGESVWCRSAIASHSLNRSGASEPTNSSGSSIKELSYFQGKNSSSCDTEAAAKLLALSGQCRQRQPRALRTRAQTHRVRFLLPARSHAACLRTLPSARSKW